MIKTVFSFQFIIDKKTSGNDSANDAGKYLVSASQITATLAAVKESGFYDNVENIDSGLVTFKSRKIRSNAKQKLENEIHQRRKV